MWSLSLTLAGLFSMAWSAIFGSDGGKSGRASVEALEAVRVLPIEASIAIEPSGLCLRDGRLYSVSDDTDDLIFEVVLEEGVARFEPALRFRPPSDSAGALDLEGLAVGPEGSFYALSERHARVLQVLPDGTSRWASPSALSAGRAAGLFRENSGRAEGLAVLPAGDFLLAAERQARGLIVHRPPRGFEAQALPRTRFSSELALLRPTDFTGLDVYVDQVFVLFRNAELVTTLERDAEGEWREGPVAWSFKEMVGDRRYRYQDPVFGHAEGLAVDADHFYVVLDNNKMPRFTDPTDSRPLLLILKRP